MPAQPDAFLAALLYGSALISALVVSCAMLIYIAFNRHIVMRRYMIAAVSGGLIINLLFLLMAVLPDENAAYLVARLRFSAFAVASLIWFFALMAYSGRYELLSWRWVALLAIVPLVAQIVLWTNDAHGEFLRAWSRQPLSFLWLEMPTFGSWYWVHNAYLNLIVIIANLRLLYFFWMRPDTYRGSFVILLIVAIVATALSTVSMFNAPPERVLPNLTPLAFTLVNIFLFFAFARHRVLDVTPIAYHSVVLNLSDPVFVIDEAGRLAMINPSGEALLGKPAEKLVGNLAQSVFPQPYHSLLNNTHLESFRLELALTVGEKQRYYDAHLSALRHNGRRIGSIMVMRDITLRKKAEIEREYLIADLQAYAHIVAHDLKNPLSVIAGYLELLTLIDPNAREEWQEYLQHLIKMQRKMTDIIHDLLTLATVRQGVSVPSEMVNIHTTLHNALQRLQQPIAESGAHIEITSDLPDAYGYAAWIEQVWINILSNAIKFGGKPPHIQVSARREGAMIRYCVQDNGKGLTTAQIAQVFKPFTRYDDGRIEGHGVGLSIVKSILEKLKGEVGAESVVGSGSTFYFCLPAAQTPETALLEHAK
ncbi:MAG: PAS domain S-box protein [Chloroflexi bacterium CFX4]|nr:PAS domain S-box protein [Chloroflexi bacterium CFX4]MDL1922348.1 PAS domain S-box protein [Chloroflexi bacterium CFX3]